MTRILTVFKGVFWGRVVLKEILKNVKKFIKQCTKLRSCDTVAKEKRGRYYVPLISLIYAITTNGIGTTHLKPNFK